MQVPAKQSKSQVLRLGIIYCCKYYDLYEGITFTKKNAKEKQLYLAEKQKALELKAAYDKAQADVETLNAALEQFASMAASGDKVKHNKFGEGIFDSIDEQYIVATFPEKKAKVSLAVGIANGLISLEHSDFAEKASEYKDVLKAFFWRQNSREIAQKELSIYSIDSPLPVPYCSQDGEVM